MLSNVRKYDESCKIVAKRDNKFYQCIVCDPLKRLFICQNCKLDGQHEGHSLIESMNVDSIMFCDCGDRTGVYECQKHKRFNVINEDRPLHYDDLSLLKFIKSFNMTVFETRILSRLYQIRNVEMSSTDGQIIENYFINSNSHNKELVLINCWSAYRKDREINFVEKGYDQTRRLLLWHGTRKQNLSGILQQGFRKPDDEAVVNGSMFGRGIYFADRVSKSAHFSDKDDPLGLLLLCEVALGSMYRTGLRKNYEDVPPEFDSIKGLGKSIPDKSGETMFGDVIVPSGKTVNSTHPMIEHSQLNFNEYIVFDPDRILIKFILTFKLKPTECLTQQTSKPRECLFL